MKPDFEEFDDYAESDSPRSRAMSWVVLGIALSGFVALAWYAYQSGSESVQDGQMVVIKADTSAIKEKPADAGGEQFPHQDKTIYDTISPYRADNEAKVEKLLPEAEEPVAVKLEAKNQDTKTWVNDKLKRESDAEERINAQLEKKTAEKKPEEPVKAPIQAEAPKVVAEKVVETKVEPKTEAPKAEAKAIVEEAPPVVEAAKPAPSTVPVPASTPAPEASGSGYKVQLGAYGSEAEAKQNWARISSKHAAILSGVPHVIQRAEVGGRIVYRLRTSGYATPVAAKQACAKLSAAGQACYFAGK
ncbi:MAG: SPOR domain-containing protein [Alphaproteobacteria bacterium]|nr:SPOR domain-containing protein [Alphaproteobacteria bacterium]